MVVESVIPTKSLLMGYLLCRLSTKETVLIANQDNQTSGGIPPTMKGS